MPNAVLAFIASFLHKIEALFSKPAVQAAFNTVAQVLVVAEPIVAEIAALVPNKTVAEIMAAYEAYGVPVAATIAADPTSTGNALLNLATTLVDQKIKNAAATNIIQTAVQIAVTALKAA